MGEQREVGTNRLPRPLPQEADSSALAGLADARRFLVLG